MITTIAKAGLPVDELQEIKKMRLKPVQGANGKRISIVTGIHGDELEGQYVCFKLANYVKEHRECLTGIVDIYPALNPFGIDSITKEYGDQLFEGILHLMKQLGIWNGEDYPVRKPAISSGCEDVCFLNASSSGIFLKNRNHGALLNKGDFIGTIINPLSGDVIDEITSPVDGWLFTIREYPVVNEGSLMGRILKKEIYEA